MMEYKTVLPRDAADLYALEALRKSATQGEWLNRGGGAISAKKSKGAPVADGNSILTGFEVRTELTPVAQMGAPDGARYASYGERNEFDHDAALIVAAVNMLQPMIDRIRLLEGGGK